MVKYCVQASVGENKMQIDLSSLDPVFVSQKIFNGIIEETELFLQKLYKTFSCVLS